MSKQRRNFNMARIRPTSYSHVYTKEEFQKQESKSNKFFSNLFHNYQKVSKGDQKIPKLTFLHLQKGDSAKTKPIEVELKHLERKLPFQSPFLTHKSSFHSERQRPSNYSLYLQRSISKRFHRSSQRCVVSNQVPSELSRSEMFEPCKITPMRIQIRRIQPEIIKEYKDSAEIIRKRNKKGKLKMASELNIGKKIGEEMIEPWGLKNYQSIML